MNRLTIALLLAALTGPSAASANEKLSGQKAMAVYRKGYTLLSGKQARGLQRVKELKQLRPADYDIAFSKATLMGQMSKAASRQALVAEATKTFEAELLKEDEARIEREAQQKAAAKPKGLIQRWRERNKPVVVEVVGQQQAKVDPVKLQRRVADFERSLDGLEQRLAQLQDGLKIASSRSARALKLDQPYGNPNVADHATLLAGMNKVIDEVEARLPSTLIKKFEGSLMSRMTKQVIAERPAFEAQLKEGKVEELHAEALDLIQEIRELSHAETMRSETTLTGGGESGSLSVSHARALGGLYQRTAVSESSSHWSLEGRTLLPEGSDYTLYLRDSSLPHTREYSSAPFKATGGMLPLEARILLEKALRVSEIFGALGKRAPALAGNLAPWISQSRFVVQLPREGDHGWGSDVPSKISYKPVVISMTRPKADLLQLVNAGLIDQERADMFRTELDKKLIGGLK